jgi:hypothetical protein
MHLATQDAHLLNFYFFVFLITSSSPSVESGENVPVDLGETG